jgi:hypothetical protein
MTNEKNLRGVLARSECLSVDRVRMFLRLCTISNVVHEMSTSIFI